MSDATVVADRLLQAFNQADWGTFRAGLADDAVYVEAGTGRRIEGADAYLALCQGWKAALPDVQGTVERVLADGSTVAQEVTWRGTHAGPLETPGGTVPPTGASVTVPATLWMSVSGDAVAEVHHHLDVLTLLAQIGAWPDPSLAQSAPVERSVSSGVITSPPWSPPAPPPTGRRARSSARPADQAAARAPRTHRTIARSDSRTRRDHVEAALARVDRRHAALRGAATPVSSSSSERRGVERAGQAGGGVVGRALLGGQRQAGQRPGADDVGAHAPEHHAAGLEAQGQGRLARGRDHGHAGRGRRRATPGSMPASGRPMSRRRRQHEPGRRLGAGGVPGTAGLREDGAHHAPRAGVVAQDLGRRQRACAHAVLLEGCQPGAAPVAGHHQPVAGRATGR